MTQKVEESEFEIETQTSALGNLEGVEENLKEKDLRILELEDVNLQAEERSKAAESEA